MILDTLFARALLGVLGWKFEGQPPAARRAVCLAFPHTDNYDGLLLVLLAKSVEMKMSWMVKDVWGRPPIGWLVRAVGGLPIDRSQKNGMVDQMVGELKTRDDFYLVIPPEGTRSRSEHWKSGFYRIALGAGVPVMPGFLDYRTKRGGFGPPIVLTGDVRKDMDVLRSFYAEKQPVARHPEKVGPIRLREED